MAPKRKVREEVIKTLVEDVDEQEIEYSAVEKPVEVSVSYNRTDVEVVIPESEKVKNPGLHKVVSVVKRGFKFREEIVMKGSFEDCHKVVRELRNKYGRCKKYVVNVRRA